jgi:hypothetical protein
VSEDEGVTNVRPVPGHSGRAEGVDAFVVVLGEAVADRIGAGPVEVTTDGGATFARAVALADNSSTVGVILTPEHALRLAAALARAAAYVAPAAPAAPAAEA